MSMRLHRAPCLGLFLFLGCQQPPDISGDIGTYADLLSDANSLACECPQILGYATISECDDAMSAVSSGERQCLANVLEGHEDEAKDHLECANAAYQQYVDCLGTNVSCEESVYNDCTMDHETALAACPQLSEGVRPSFDACTS
jgi:hypothetical protein